MEPVIEYFPAAYELYPVPTEGKRAYYLAEYGYRVMRGLISMLDGHYQLACLNAAHLGSGRLAGPLPLPLHDRAKTDSRDIEKALTEAFYLSDPLTHVFQSPPNLKHVLMRFLGKWPTASAQPEL